jgi:hypothetical protein
MGLCFTAQISAHVCALLILSLSLKGFNCAKYFTPLRKLKYICLSAYLLPKIWQFRRKFGSLVYPLLITLLLIFALCGVKNSAVLTFRYTQNKAFNRGMKRAYT